jgi:hypothetical protein
LIMLVTGSAYAAAAAAKLQCGRQSWPLACSCSGGCFVLPRYLAPSASFNMLSCLVQCHRLCCNGSSFSDCKQQVLVWCL